MALWLVRGGRNGEHENRMFQENRIFFNWDEINTDLSKLPNKEKFKDFFHKTYPNQNANKVGASAGQGWNFTFEMKIGDWFVLPSKNNNLNIFVGKITSDYSFNSENENRYRHCRSIEWVAKNIDRRIFPEDILNSFGSLLTISNISRNNIEIRLKEIQENNWKPETEKSFYSTSNIILPTELISAFNRWLELDEHLKNENHYTGTINKKFLEGLSKKEFIDFYIQFTHDGGKVQSGGERAKGILKKSIENDFPRFKGLILKSFDDNLDPIEWLKDTMSWKGFGPGNATIFLNRVNSLLYPILNNKKKDFLKLAGIALPNNLLKAYENLIEIERNLLRSNPELKNLYRIDSLFEFILKENECKQWIPDPKAIFASNYQCVEASCKLFEVKEMTKTYTLDEAQHEIFLSKERMEEIILLLKARKNIVLQGPPGVGKTFLAKRLAYAAMQEKCPERVEMVQFHQSYGYEEFVRGWRPNEDGGFELVDGTFLKFCIKAHGDRNNDYFFIIDELNRGNLTRIFGEIMLLIEGDKRSPEFALTLSNCRKGEDTFHIPENVHLIGMMNTADRSLAMVDYALRRRFVFFDIDPAFDQIFFSEWLIKKGCKPNHALNIVSKMKELNQEIAKDKTNLGPGYRIGHSYFCPVDHETPDEKWYSRIIKYEIKPLLHEYWFDNPDKVSEMIEFLLS